MDNKEIENISNHNSPGLYDVEVRSGKNLLTTITVQAKSGAEATELAAKQLKVIVKKQWK